MGVPILRVWDETRKKYVGIPAIRGEPGSGAGTPDHAQLINRDASEQHPIEAITNLEGTLLNKVSASDALTNMEIEKLLGGLT